MATNDDGHRWEERSRHLTSDGLVIYQGCHCGVVRVRTLDLTLDATRAAVPRSWVSQAMARTSV